MRTIFILFSLSVSFTTFAQVSATKFSSENKANFYCISVTNNHRLPLTACFKQYTILKVPATKITAFFSEKNNVSVNIGLQITDSLLFNLQLVQNLIIADNFLLTTQTPQGKVVINNHPNYFYKGKLLNEEQSDVRISIKEGIIYGYIKKGGKEFFIDPLSRYDKNLPADEFIFYEVKDIVNTDISCGFTDVLQTQKQLKQELPGVLSPNTPPGIQTVICKKVKTLIAADYSMYKAFNNDIDALQTFLLGNLNIAEGLFNTLNLDSTISGDVGTDFLHFEVQQMHVSVCDSCDFINNTDYAGTISTQFVKWLKENAAINPSVVNQFWSTRNLFVSPNNVGGYSNTIGLGTDSNCAPIGVNLIKYFSQDAITLRLQVAHEAGHTLGCQHDNNYNPSITSFIMNSSGTYSPNGRFSRLSDFGGINYSSQLAISNNVLHSPCIQDCTSQTCEPITGLKVSTLNSSDSVKISWLGSGNFLVKYKIKDTINYNIANQITVTGNEVVLKKLSSCTNYTVQIQKICTVNETGRVSSISFNSSPFTVQSKAINNRADRYDLQLQLDCKNCTAKNITIKVDHIPYNFSLTQFPSIVTVPNLFADGARHRLDYTGDNINGGCNLFRFYKAPYYRENSIKVIAENFDSCQIATDWKDSIVRTLPNSPSRKWAFTNLARGFGIDDSYFIPGNFDSTCMAYNTSGFGYGSNTLTLPSSDIAKLNNVYLSFDYQYFCYKLPQFATSLNAFFKIQVFDGTQWQNIFELNQQELFNRSFFRRSVWDTIPSRKFINLDQYNNSKFQVRFIVDDGNIINSSTNTIERTLLFLYLDNIRIDGYDKVKIAAQSSFAIFPNPATTEIFVTLFPLTTENITYKLVDASGRMIQQEKLINYRINLSRLSAGIYFLMLYKENEQFGKTVKVMKY